MPAQTMSQCLDAALKQMRATGREVRRDGDYILFTVGDVTYDIPLSSCKTHQQILRWSLHLLRKRWIERRHVEAFVHHACEANNLETPE